MNSVLYGYAVNEPTWAYLSTLLVISVYFRFGRVWSSRNLDLILLLSLAPGMLMVRQPDTSVATEAVSTDQLATDLAVGSVSVERPATSPAPDTASIDLPDREMTPVPGVMPTDQRITETVGYVWLLVVTGLLVVRAFYDPWQKWRPQFDQNMTESGMLFLGVCSLLFLAVRASSEDTEIPAGTVETVAKANALAKRQVLDSEPVPPEVSAGVEANQSGEATATEGDMEAGPGAPFFAFLVNVLFGSVAARVLAILSHLAVVCGMLWAGRRTFGTAKSGVAMATLYLLLPPTAYDVGAVNHVLPAALTMWAFVLHRKPAAAGVLLGFAGATQVFPLFLVPVWTSYYGKAGVKRFLLGFLLALAGAAGSLVLVAADAEGFFQLVLGSFYPYLNAVQAGETGGFWGGGPTWSLYRLPVMVAYGVLVIVFTFSPRPKSSEMLLAQSLVLVLATQFWVPHGGGLYVLWYLPLLLLMMFRPRLPDPFVIEDPTNTVRAVTPSVPTRGGTVTTGKLR